MQELTPRQIVAELDKFIVGQQAAKRAVAVALRNRVRRGLVDEEMREEITPKNMMMIGPTGVGKTEIARRVAKLIDAPFTSALPSNVFILESSDSPRAIPARHTSEKSVV